MLRIFISLALITTLLFGCGRKINTDKVIATINGEPIYVTDFNRSLALNIKRDPMFRVTPQTLDNQINILIDKRLLIQQAKKKKLDQTDKFVNTIKAFWEQTLIRDLMERKDEELDKSLSVTEDEMHDYYDKLSYQMTFKVLKQNDRSVIDRLIKENPDSIQWEEEIGPIGYDDISSPVISMAFDIPEGKMDVIQDRDIYYLIYASKKEQIPIQPLEEIKPEITERIKRQKKQRLFSSWLSDMRNNADIKINTKILRGLKYADK